MQLLGHLRDAPNRVALEVEGKNWIVQRETQQEPPITVFLVTRHADSLIVVGDNGPPWNCCRERLEFFDDLRTILCKVRGEDFEAHLFVLFCLREAEGTPRKLGQAQKEEEEEKEEEEIIHLSIREVTETGFILAILMRILTTK